MSTATATVTATATTTATNETIENDVFGVATMPCRMNSVKMVTNSNCKEYVLYVSSTNRMNARIQDLDLMPYLDEVLSDDDKKLHESAGVEGIKLNSINLIRQKNPEAFEEIKLAFFKSVPTHWYFIGVSSDGVFSWFEYPEIAHTAQRYLETSVQGGKIVKIVFTEHEECESAPTCLPYYSFNDKYMKLKYSPRILLNNDDGSGSAVCATIKCDAKWSRFIRDFIKQKNKMNRAQYY